MPDAISPENVIAKWLQRVTDDKDYSGFEFISLAESEKLRSEIVEPLAITVFIHHNDPEKFRQEVANLGYSEAAESFDKRPHNHETRMGNFGEVLAAEYLRQLQGYTIPVYRLRYNPNPESAMKGNDLLAFKFGEANGRGRELVVGEVKVRDEFETRTVEEAYAQLSRERPRPKSIPFIVEVLRDQGKNEEADQVTKFLDKTSLYQPAKASLLFLVTGNQPRDPFKYIQNMPSVLDNLTAAHIYISELTALVVDTFTRKIQVVNEP